ncbi:MAG TPA: nitroreductase [Planctomycetaceae bacterium]|nr:nitroreductase [Planctomycetaceae bacterium]
MDIFETLARRHSYRGEFTNAPVSRDDFVKILQAGIDAPSGCNAQSTSFVAIDDPLLIQSIANMLDRPYTRTAKAMIACVCDKTPARPGSEAVYYKEDAGAAVENMLLAVTALGYATVWLQGAISGEIATRIARLLSVPEKKELLVLLPVGVPKSEGKPNPKRPFGQRVAFNKYSF